MKQISNVNYGSTEPDSVQYHPDQVVVNTNIQLHESEEGNYYTADATFYTYPEYSRMQDSVIAEQKAINEEHDELLAELIEQ